MVYRHGGSIDFHDTTELSEQPLLAGLSAEELAALAALGTTKTWHRGEKIVGAGEPATSLFFLGSGVVHVTLPDGVRLATLTAGMAFGEMALLENHRSADVLADAVRHRRRDPARRFRAVPRCSTPRPANGSCATSRRSWPTA